ncbi:putative membrane protein [Methanolinea mesophila]|uniref:small multi-drug export protein n=1 Tax=Methanolinea mesophila TaxID=547055 RepID=UPI001AE38887|nr:small multi-drug export protein [Methanolinea mesophila]MBP1929202.1 putative membrane protein [Methanolinea mesophila]
MEKPFFRAIIIFRQILKAFFFFFIFGLAIPLFIGVIAGVPVGVIVALISSTFLLQATASPVGVGMGLSPAVILSVMTSFAVGMVLGILEICDTFAQSSEKVRNWLDKVEKKMQKVKIIYKYGSISCVFISWIPGLGLYSTPVIAWLFRWKRLPAVFFTVLGFFLVSLGFLLLSEGLITIF